MDVVVVDAQDASHMTMGVPRGGMEHREVACQASVRRDESIQNQFSVNSVNQFRIDSELIQCLHVHIYLPP